MLKDLEQLARKYEHIANRALHLQHENGVLHQKLQACVQQLEVFVQDRIHTAQENAMLKDQLTQVEQSLRILLSTLSWTHQEGSSGLGFIQPPQHTQAQASHAPITPIPAPIPMSTPETPLQHVQYHHDAENTHTA